MIMNTLNPFPDYPVTRLRANRESSQTTVVTLAIKAGRQLVDEYVQGMGRPVQSSQTGAALCAVRGDYGTGKTFLLNDVAAHLTEACGGSSPPSVLRATCIETDPLSWFKAKVGQRLNELPLDDVALRLYVQAGVKVAKSTAMTESAAHVLQEDPTRIRQLIRENQLSVDEVGREFQRLLEVVCKDFDETVRRVLARLVSSETEGPARQWISGATLSARDAELLGVPPAIDSADRVSSLIGAIAAVHKAVGRPFVLLVDELEHFVGHDRRNNSWGNVTWLKRLLEHLGNTGALALVAGHWDAWKTTADYLDRFPQHAPIDLVKVKPGDVADIVARFLDGMPNAFGEEQCQEIAKVTEGNMRRVMSLCNLLFRQTGGFETQLTPDQIREAWQSVAQRIPQEQALEESASLLDRRGFDTRMEAQFDKLSFDLVAERADGRVILVEAKHANRPGAHYDAARRFIDKLSQVSSGNPKVVGMFIANGSIDDELQALLRNSGRANLRWFDLTARDVMDRIRDEIHALDGEVVSPTPASGLQAKLPAAAAPVPAVAQAESAALNSLAADFEKRLRELDEKRSREVQQLQERLERASAQNSPRDESIRDETRKLSLERERTSYEAMLEEPSTNKKLRYLGAAMFLGITYIAMGLVFLLSSEAIAIALSLNLASGQAISITAIAFGTTLLVMGPWVIWHRYSLVTEYFEFSRQTIRDLYLRDLPINELSRVNAMLRLTIERVPVSLAREVAVDKLGEGDFAPTVKMYVHETMRP
jgi:Ca2+/Na+ antiporter